MIRIKSEIYENIWYEWIEGTNTINILNNKHVAFSIDNSITKPSLSEAKKTIENYEKAQECNA